MKNEAKNLNTIVTKTASQWKERAKKDRANRKSITRAQKFALTLLEYLDENEIKQKELAQLMGVSPQQVSKILRAKSNLTFETIDKIEEALNITFCDLKIKNIRNRQSSLITSAMTVVHKNINKSSEEFISSKEVSKKNAVLETTIESMNYYEHTVGQI